MRAASEPVATAPAQRPATAAAGRLRVGVVAWDMGHNPVGRAFLLADMHRRRHDVELLGPCFPRYGDGIWPPIRESPIPMRTFRPTTFREFVQGAMERVRESPFDIVHVCKPRLPSLLIGLFYKLFWNTPVILDVDDWELSFVGAEQGLDDNGLEAALAPADWDAPFSDTWTRYGEGMLDLGDSLTVSNPTLRDRFGGRVVRHARDERTFDPALYDRHATRARFGLTDEDRVILFVGTTRQYKGVFETAAALDAINDPRNVLCIVGSIRDRRVHDALKRSTRARIVYHDDQPFERLPEIVHMGDVVCLLQDPAHAASLYQIPAKLTDALAMGATVLATRVPPLRDVIDSGAAIEVDAATLAPTLQRVLGDPALRARQAARGRAFFLDELGYGVNATRLEAATKDALARRGPVPARYTRLLNLLQDRLSHPLGSRDFLRLTAPLRAARPTLNLATRSKINIAFFWKQNDSGIYGRRSDMVCKYLARHERVNKVVHFDAPIGLKGLLSQAGIDEEARFRQGNFVVRNTIERFLHLQDEPTVVRRAFVHADAGGDALLGQRLPAAEDYAAFVEETLVRAGAQENLVAWVCPVCMTFPALADKLRFPVIVADVIDNHLSWNLAPSHADRVRKNYADILGAARIAFANCDAVRDAMLPLNPNIHVVPNGAEIPPPGMRWPRPAALDRIRGPILGYVGNLSDRLRLPLLDRIAREHPEWSLVFIGSAHLKTDALALRRYPNCHFLGVVPYEQAAAHIAHFDAALIPHESNTMTESMNPLKLYVYASIGVPVVTTAVSNLEDLGRRVLVSRDDDEFIHNITRALAMPRTAARIGAKVRAVAWTARVQTMFDHLLQTL